jgi:hypothetical protein
VLHNIYEGESKIIHSVDTCCAAGWACCDTCGLLVSYCCGADVTLTVDVCHEFCVINLDGPLFICTKEEQRAVLCFLWAERCTRCRNAWKDISAVWEQCRVTTGGLRTDREIQEWSHKHKASGSFLMLNACDHSWTSRSIRRPPAVTRHYSQTALISFSAFRHLVHLSAPKKQITALCSSLVQMKSALSKFTTQNSWQEWTSKVTSAPQQ